MLQTQNITQDAADFLEDLVLDYMRQAKMFTSLDIANQAKAAGHRIRNYQVGNWLVTNVIPLAKEGSYLYNQSLIKVDSKAVGMTLAYLYHHYMDDKDDYQDRDQNPRSFVVPKTQLPGFMVDPLQLIQQNRTPMANLLHPSVPALPTTYFRSRELARDFARDHNDYKFVDQGACANTGERWSCVPR